MIDLDALADEAEMAFGIHWSVCRSKDDLNGCRKCDQLDEAARVAERNAAFLGPLEAPA